MISRYGNKEIDNIWTDENKYNTWLQVEIAACEAWNKLKVIPNKDLELIKAKAKVNLPRFFKIEEETKHDIVAFTRMISEKLGNEKKWIHLGLTSTDVVDTSQNYLIKESNEIILKKLLAFKEVLKKQAIVNKSQIIMGRSHGIFGEPTSLGLKFLLWYAEIDRQIIRFKTAAKAIEVVKLSCSMGNFAHIEFGIEEYVAKKFGLDIDPITTQVTQRDRHVALFSVFANIASTLEKIATEIRLFQRSEVGELIEGFTKGQKGSSSMPHKKNPIGSENICGLSRLIISNASVSLENNVLWHERDISHSSNERIIIPDSYNLLAYTLTRITNVIKNIVINKENIAKNIAKCNNVFFSQVILTHIIKYKNVTREEIYDFIQKCTFECMTKNKDFKEILINNGINKWILEKELNDLFNINYFIRQVDKLFKRVIN